MLAHKQNIGILMDGKVHISFRAARKMQHISCFQFIQKDCNYTLKFSNFNQFFIIFNHNKYYR